VDVELQTSKVANELISSHPLWLAESSVARRTLHLAIWLLFNG